MKKAILSLAVLMITLSASAQQVKESEVHLQVKTAFKRAHTNLKKIKWEKEGENYEAEFESAGTEQSVLMNVAGTVLETETEIPLSELPLTAKEYVAKHYSGAKINEAARIVDAKGVVTYEAELKGKDLIFNAQGAFIKEIAN